MQEFINMSSSYSDGETVKTGLRSSNSGKWENYFYSNAAFVGIVTSDRYMQSANGVVVSIIIDLA